MDIPIKIIQIQIIKKNKFKLKDFETKVYELIYNNSKKNRKFTI